MKTRWVGEVVILTAMMGFIPAATAQLSWDRTTVVLEAVPGVEQLVGEFTYTNDSGERVEIVEVQTSCSCTAGSLAKREIPPGETGTVQLVFDVGNRIGPQTKIMTLQYAGGLPPTLLTLKTDIPPVARVSPKMIYWMRGQNPTPKRITVAPQIDSEIRFRIEPDAVPGFSLDLRKDKESGYIELWVTPSELNERRTVALKLISDYRSRPGAEPWEASLFVLIR